MQAHPKSFDLSKIRENSGTDVSTSCSDCVRNDIACQNTSEFDIFLQKNNMKTFFVVFLRSPFFVFLMWPSKKGSSSFLRYKYFGQV